MQVYEVEGKKILVAEGELFLLQPLIGTTFHLQPGIRGLGPELTQHPVAIPEVVVGDPDAPSKWYCVRCQHGFKSAAGLGAHRRFKHKTK